MAARRCLLLRQAAGDLQPSAPLSMASFAVSELVPGLSQRWWTATAAFADIDGDGHQDVVVGNYYRDGSEITDANSSRPFEMNSDFTRARNGGKSRIFLFVDGQSGATPAARYRDAGDVFPAIPRTPGRWRLAPPISTAMGCPSCTSRMTSGPTQLLWNRSKPGSVAFQELHGEKGFFRPASMVIGQDSFKGMSIDFGDVNNDGIFDMSVSNIGSPFALQESHFLWTSTGKTNRMSAGIAPWVDRADDVGVAHSAWAWDTRFEDFDNDGVLELVQATGLVKGTVNRWPDLAQVGGGNDVFVKYQANWPKFLEGSEVDGSYPNPFWALGSDGRYVELSSTVFPGLIPATRGIAVADVDGDGVPEMVYANFWEDSTYIKNQSASGSFLGLHLLLPVKDGDGAVKPPTATRVHDGHPSWREGTPAIGAFVEAETSDGRRLIRQVDGGNGHSGQRSPDVRFGLGRASAAAIPVHITWRDFHGALHHEALSLAPGYHTVVLAAQGETR